MPTLMHQNDSSIGEGNRNNTLFRYGAALVDAGYGLDDIMLKVKAFNTKIPKPLAEQELMTTVINSVTKNFYKKGQQSSTTLVD